MFTGEDNGKESASAVVMTTAVLILLVAAVTVVSVAIILYKMKFQKSSDLEVCACIVYLQSLQSVFQNVSITCPNLSMLLYASNSCV